MDLVVKRVAERAGLNCGRCVNRARQQVRGRTVPHDLLPAQVTLRNGYEDGSHSEIEVRVTWRLAPSEIEEHGLRLLRFMEKWWQFNFENDAECQKMLFLNSGQRTKILLL